MSKLSAISALKEADLQIPEGPATGATLREAFRRLFAELNPYFDGLNKLAAKGITFADNVQADVVTGQFSHGVAQQVALKTLKRAASALALSADGVGALWASVQMVQQPPTSKQGPAASLSVFFSDPAASKINCTILLLPEGSQTTTVPVYPQAWVAPSFLNSWVNLGAPNPNTGYYKDLLGLVHVRLYVKNGTVNTAFFNLPAAYRPASELNPILVWSSGVGAQPLTVKVNGDVGFIGAGNTAIVGEAIFDTRG